MRILVTGSSGLIGGEAVEYFGTRGHEIVGVDNNMRRVFFGEGGDTLWNLHRVAHKVPNYKHHESDIRDLSSLKFHVFKGKPFDAVIHCAAQPSHDFASKNPNLDYEVNVLGTKNMLEATKEHSPNAVFIFMSTNKVYDDAVNASTFQSLETRLDHPDFDETTSTGAHNIFGSHKLEADELVQSYAKKGLKTVVLRGGCLTGPGHSGVELHGFLSYLVKCAVTRTKYRIFGYGGKQVRDNIHSHDVMFAMDEIIKNPRAGEAYNIGGGRMNSTSIIEAIAKIKDLTGLEIETEYVNEERSGDHPCYITDLTKLRAHYSNWNITRSLDDIFSEMIQQVYWGRYSDHEDTKVYDLNEESVVVDIGGYRGAFSQEMVDRYNPYVYIFEPVREAYEACVRRFSKNPKVFVFNQGLMNTTGIEVIARQGQNSSLFRGGSGQESLEIDPTYGAACPEEIKLVDASHAIDSIIAKRGQIDLMSLNCEGGEFLILPRLIQTEQIKQVKNVQVQFHRFVPNADTRRHDIQQELAKTHKKKFDYPWVWESWTKQ